jgi:GAF domain-containing protein
MVDPEDRERIVGAVRASPLSGPRLRAEAMRLLAGLPGYDWCGVYRLDDLTLILDEYTGAPTEHTRIPIGDGVCGMAIEKDANQIVADVRTVPHYLACSGDTLSEIVVLIRRQGRVLGQIDVDSHAIGTFGAEDEELLEAVAKVLAERWDAD